MFTSVPVAPRFLAQQPETTAAGYNRLFTPLAAPVGLQATGSSHGHATNTHLENQPSRHLARRWATNLHGQTQLPCVAISENFHTFSVVVSIYDLSLSQCHMGTHGNGNNSSFMPWTNTVFISN